MADVVPPFWFIQRQGKAEQVGDHVLRLTAPNMDVAFLAIQPAEGSRWSAALRKTADGADAAATATTFPTEREAWEAAFELYRVNLIV